MLARRPRVQVPYAHMCSGARLAIHVAYHSHLACACWDYRRGNISARHSCTRAARMQACMCQHVVHPHDAEVAMKKHLARSFELLPNCKNTQNLRMCSLPPQRKYGERRPHILRKHFWSPALSQSVQRESCRLDASHALKYLGP